MSEAPSKSVENTPKPSRLDQAKEAIFADKNLTLAEQVAKAGELQRRATDMLDDLASEYGNKAEYTPTESKVRTLGANALSAITTAETTTDPILDPEAERIRKSEAAIAQFNSDLGGDPANLDVANLPAYASDLDPAATAGSYPAVPSPERGSNERIPQIDGYVQSLEGELSGVTESEQAAESEKIDNVESTTDSEPTVEQEKRTTFREWRRENRRIAKDVSTKRKANKKELRDKVAQDKATAEILEYNNDIKDGRIKTSKIGSVLRRLKGTSFSAGRATGRGLKATARGIKRASVKTGQALKNSITNDNYDNSYVGAPSPDSDAETGGRHANGNETPEAVTGGFVEPEAVIRGKKRSVTAYNDSLTRVRKDIESKGGDVSADVKVLYRPEPVKLKSKEQSQEKKAA